MYTPRNNFPQFGSYAENDSSKIFSCIRASANTGPACIREKITSPRIFSAFIGFVPGGIAEIVSWYRAIYGATKHFPGTCLLLVFLPARLQKLIAGLFSLLSRTS